MGLYSHFFPVRIDAAALTTGTFEGIKVSKFIIRINGIASALAIRALTLVLHCGDMILVSCFFPLVIRVK